MILSGPGDILNDALKSRCGVWSPGGGGGGTGHGTTMIAHFALVELNFALGYTHDTLDMNSVMDMIHRKIRRSGYFVLRDG